MAWKCSKCGMPNYKEGNCVLCGEPMPENPEEYVDPKKKKANEPFLPDPDHEPENDVAKKPSWGVVTDQEKKEPVKPVAPKESAPSPRPVAPSPRTTAPAATPKPAAPSAKPAAPAPKAGASAAKPTAQKKTTAPKKKSSKGSTVIVLFVIIALSAVCLGLYTMIENLKEEPAATIKQSAKPTRTATVPPSAEPSLFPSVEPSFDPYADPSPSATASVSAVPGTVPSGAPTFMPSASPSVVPATVAPSAAPKKTETPKKTAAPKKTTAPKKTAAPAPVNTPAPAATPKPASSLPSKPSTPVSSDYKLYTNNTYGFSCAYPADFYTDGSDSSALASLRSSDYTAFMNIRAQKHDGSSAEAAMNDYLACYGATATEKSFGDNWYIAVFVQNDRVFYRKAYIDGNNLVCFDFNCRQREYENYADDLAYIGNYFYKN